MSSLWSGVLACLTTECGPAGAGLVGWLALGAAALGLGLVGCRRALTAVMTLRARALVPGLSRRLARLVRPRSYSDAEFFRADGAGEMWATRRRLGLERLAAGLRAA